jgi:hypothetical protein
MVWQIEKGCFIGSAFIPESIQLFFQVEQGADKPLDQVGTLAPSITGLT